MYGCIFVCVISEEKNMCVCVSFLQQYNVHSKRKVMRYACYSLKLFQNITNVKPKTQENVKLINFFFTSQLHNKDLSNVTV